MGRALSRGRRRLPLCILAAALGVAGGWLPGRGQAPPSEPTLRVVTPEGQGSEAGLGVHVEVAGLPPRLLLTLSQASLNRAEWTELLAVYVVDPKASSAAPAALDPVPGAPPVAILGEYQVAGEVLRFVPSFPLQPGLEYRAVLRLGYATDAADRVEMDDLDPIVHRFHLPKPPSPATTAVRQIYPSSPELPENLLKFYLHFSAPMSQGNAYRHVHLLEESGREVELPFLELDEELWDPEGTRLTLLLDPGRIKSGLLPRDEEGPALRRGQSYALVVGRDWLDAAGRPMQAGHRKVFRVLPADRRGPDPDQWQIAPPMAGTRQPLAVRFREPLDSALLHRLLWVTGPGGETVAGESRVSSLETLWQWLPEAPWLPGAYELVAAAILEDLAGNRIDRPFEVDLRSPSTESQDMPAPGGRTWRGRFRIVADPQP